MNTAKKEMSNQAQVAKICRQYLKGLGVKCTATSDSFSMGDSVNVKVFDQSPFNMEMINTELNQYQYGHFDGMIDMYEYSNSNKDIPQTKYLSIGNELSLELRQKAWDFLRVKFSGNAKDLPESYEDARNMQLIEGSPHYMTISDDVYKLLNGSGFGLDKEYSIEFWENNEDKPEPPKPTTKAAEGVTISEGTRAGFTQIQFSGKPSADIRTELKSAGFRWSPKNSVWYGKTENLPSRYQGGEVIPDNVVSMPVKVSGDKFRALAEAMQSTIDNKSGDKLTNTPKRVAQAAHARLDGEKLQRTQSALFALADLQDAGTLPEILQNISSKKAVFDLMGEKSTPCANGFHSYHIGTGEPANITPQAVALWELLTGKTDEEKKEEEIKRKIEGLQFSQIAGYFPTPDPVIDIMLDYAQLESHHIVLEPNLGSCAIADRVAPLCEKVEGFEINFTLAEICEHKGYLLKQADFLHVDQPLPVDSKTEYDRVLMNPPFENLQDIDHVLHALHFLKSGGRLVAVMSPSPFFRTDKKCELFRGIVEKLGGEVVDLPEGSFKALGTGVATKLLIIDKE